MAHAIVRPTLASPDPAAILRSSRERAVKLAWQSGAGRMHTILKTAEKDLTARLGKLHGAMALSFTSGQLQSTLTQVREVLRSVVQSGLKNTVLAVGGQAGHQAAKDSISYLKHAEARFTGITQPLALDEAAALERSRVGVRSSLLHRLEGDPTKGPGILQRYGAGVVQDFEGTLQQRFIAKVPWGEVRDRLTEQSPFLQGMPGHWAERIVRTEVMGAHNRASDETLQAAQEELGDMLKILCATFDDRTACLLGSTRVSSGVVRAIFRRRYEGLAFRVVSEGGCEFTATPNHPMLTRRGWVRADCLHLGDELVCDRRQQHSGATRDENVASRPSTIGEVFDSLSKLGNGERIRGRQEDFHGDGMECEVDVLRPDRELRIGSFASLGKPLVQERFAPTDDPLFCSECGALVGPGSRERADRLRTSAKWYVRFLEASRDECLRSVNAFSDALDRFACTVAFCDLLHGHPLPILGMAESRELHLPGLGVGAYDAAPIKFLDDVPAMDLQSCGHSRHAHSGAIEFDRVVHVQRIAIAEHVFNLSTDDGYYAAEGVYTGNCDSYAVHGQIRRPTEPFDTWQGPVMTPPARPNDREVVVPHRMSWPLPANLKPRSPAEVSARWLSEGRKGPHPPIPRYSTVDVDKIGQTSAPKVDANSSLREGGSVPPQLPPATPLEAKRTAMRAGMGLPEEGEPNAPLVATQVRQHAAIGQQSPHESPTGIRSLIWEHAEDKDDSHLGFARMRTDEVAGLLGVSPGIALRRLRAASAAGTVTKAGRAQAPGEFQGQVAGRGGWQVWEVKHPDRWRPPKRKPGEA